MNEIFNYQLNRKYIQFVNKKYVLLGVSKGCVVFVIKVVVLI